MAKWMTLVENFLFSSSFFWIYVTQKPKEKQKAPLYALQSHKYPWVMCFLFCSGWKSKTTIITKYYNDDDENIESRASSSAPCFWEICFCYLVHVH